MAEVALGLAIFGTVSSIREQRKVRKAQKKQAEVANRIQANKRVRDIKRAVALSRIRRGELQSAGFQLGIAGGTTVAGAAGGARSDLASQVSAANQQFTGQQAIATLADRIAGFQSRAATFGGIASIAGQFVGGVGSAGAQNRAAVGDFFGFGGRTGGPAPVVDLSR